MHQISLLGGLGDVQRHGGGSHYMRPDRVYRTSVLSPMVGYRPGEDVMAVSQAFTVGPQSGMQLYGLRGVGLFPRIRMWWANLRARMAHANMPAAPAATDASVPGPASPAIQTAAQPVAHTAGVSIHPGPFVPEIVQAMHVGPSARHLPGSYVTQAYGQSPALPGYASDAAAKTTMMMWRGLRWPWH